MMARRVSILSISAAMVAHRRTARGIARQSAARLRRCTGSPSWCRSASACCSAAIAPISRWAPTASARGCGEQATTDELTGLRQSRRLESRSERRLRRGDQAAAARTSVVFLDIDHFKRVNDTYGHDTGDRVLQQLGQILRERAGERSCARDWAARNSWCCSIDQPGESVEGFVQRVRRDSRRPRTTPASPSARASRIASRPKAWASTCAARISRCTKRRRRVATG